MLTKRQKQILDYFKRYIKENGYAPTLDEARRYFRLSAKSTIHKHLEALKSKGYLDKLDYQARAIQISETKKSSRLVEIPLLGTIAAGQPIEAVEIPDETITVMRDDIGKADKHYALRVEGDSMIDEGIFDGSTIIIKKQSMAENGDTVVALINGCEATLKKFYREGNRIKLQPRNPKMKSMIVDPKNLLIQGKVINIQENFVFNCDKKKVVKSKKLQKIKRLVDKSKKHTIYIGDCLNLLDQIKDNSIQLVFADPPYNMGKKFGNNRDSWNFPEQYKEWGIKWIEKCIKKLKPNGSIIIMGHPRFSSYLIPELDKRLIYTNQIIYHYTDGMPEKKNFEKRYEVVLFYRKNNDKYIFNLDSVRVPLVRHEKHSNPKGRNPGDVWQIHRVRWNSKERISLSSGKIAHAAQKPLKLMRRLIKATTNKNDFILDPFLGTGTTSVVAKELGRCSIGIELYSKYSKMALKRINETK